MTQPPEPDPTTGQPPRAPGRSSVALARSSALMASGTLVSRVLGLVRVALLTGALGVLDGNVGNAWSTANTLPNTIYLLLAGGLLNSILVPQLTRAQARADGGRDFTDRLITLMLLAIGGVAVLSVLAAPLVTKLYALSWTGEQLALAVAFAYLCMPQVFFYGLYSLLGQILHARDKFGAFMWAPVANNIVAIGGLVAFTALYPEASDTGPGLWTGPMIWLLAGTATLGVATQALVLLVPLWRSGFRWRPRFGFRGVGLGAASRMATWMFAVVGLSQAGMLLITNVLNQATNESVGVAGKLAYENAFLIYMLPHSLIATSLLTAMFTPLSRAAAVDDLDSMRHQYRHGLGLLGLAMLPVSLAMLLLVPSLTAVLFPLNTAAETNAIAWVTMAMAVGLPLYGVYLLSARVFHAFQDGRTPFRLQVAITLVTLVGVAVAVAVPDRWTAVTLGVTQPVGQAVAAFLGIRWVSRRLGEVALGPVWADYRKVAVASLAAAVPTLLVVLAAGWLMPQGTRRGLLVVLIGGVVFVAVFALVAHRLGVSQLDELAAPVLRRLRRRRTAPAAPSGPGAPLAWAPSPETPGHVSTHEQPRTHQTTDHGSPDRSATTTTDDTPGPGPDPQGRTGRQEEHTMQGIEAGTVLGSRYQLEELLAQRDDVLDYWSAQDLTLDRTVAVTVMPTDGSHAEAVLDSARRTAGVDDPRLVRVLDVGNDDTHSWIVEEGLLEAESLASLVTDGPLPAEEARRLTGEAAAALESARRRGLHHLYLTPHAVMRTREGTVKVSGVAVAAAIEQTEELPAVEATLIDTTDLVALLYTGLTGRWPGDELEGLRPARRLADGTLLAPSEVVPGVPGDLDALCRMTFGADYRPGMGPQTPGDLAHQLAPWSSEVVTGSPATPDRALPDAGGASAAIAGAAGAGAAVTAAHPWDRDGDVADETERLPRTSSSGEARAGGDDSARSAGGARAERGDAGEAGSERRAAGSGAAGAAVAAGAAGAATSPHDPSATGATGAGRPTADTGMPGAGTRSVEGDDLPPLRQEPRRLLEPDQPNRFRGLVVLLLIAALVLTGTWLAIRAISDGLDTAGPAEDDRVVPTSTPTPDQTDTAEETAEPEETEEEAAGPREEPYPVAGVSTYDSNGNEDEHTDLAPRAVDGDPDTAWNSYTYLAPDWGNLKDGVGLVVDLGETVPVSQVTVQFPEGDYGAEVFVSDDPRAEGGTSLGASEDASEEWVLTADEAVEGRYVVLWFDRAWTGPRGEIVYVSEVIVQ